MVARYIAAPWIVVGRDYTRNAPTGGREEHRIERPCPAANLPCAPYCLIGKLLLSPLTDFRSDHHVAKSTGGNMFLGCVFDDLRAGVSRTGAAPSCATTVFTVLGRGRQRSKTS